MQSVKFGFFLSVLALSRVQSYGVSCVKECAAAQPAEIDRRFRDA